MVLNKFFNKRVEQISVGEYQIVINFNSNINITLEGSIEYDSVQFSHTQIKNAAKSLLDCIGNTIKKIYIDANDTLIIEFDNNKILKALKNDIYESYQLVTDKEQIICTSEGLEKF